VPFERFLHFLVVTSFLTLVVTGMPLKFYYTDWAKFIFSVIGGPETARMLHRLGALITFLYFSLHLSSLASKAWKGRAKLRNPETGKFEMQTLLRRGVRAGLHGADLQDWRDLVAHNKWFFGKGPKPSVRPLDVLGEVRLLRRVLGRGHHRRIRAYHVVPGIFHALHARLGHQHRAHPALGRGAARRRVHLLDPLFQHAFPHRKIPDGHRDFLRPRFQDRDAARTQTLV
jgi:hypothetical protein